jgi:hypothetical protein
MTDGDDFTYSLVQTNNSVTLTYVIPSGVPRLTTFTTQQNSRFLSNISACSSSVYSSGGTITCGYNATIGDSTINMQISQDENVTLYGQVLVAEDLSSFYLLNNYFIGAILMIVLGLIFVSSGLMMIVSAVIGILFLGIVFLLKGVGLTTIATSIIWLIIGAVILAYKISKKEDRT